MKMKTVTSILMLLCLFAPIGSVMADVYMGTNADPTWSPLYPSSILPPPLEGAPPKGMMADNTSVIGVNNSAVATADNTVSQPRQFTATYSPSASSFSTNNYAGITQTPSNLGLAYGAAPCQSAQIDMVYGKGPLAPTPCPTAAGVLGLKPTTYYVTAGSLKANVERMVARSGWGKVVWNVPNDYRWTGNITITSTSIQGALDQLLGPYPVQAVFYDTNRIVDIEPRRQA